MNAGGESTPGDVAGMVRLLERLEQDRGLVREAGARARCAFEKYYDRTVGVARILSILQLSEALSPVPASAVATSAA